MKPLLRSKSEDLDCLKGDQLPDVYRDPDQLLISPKAQEPVGLRRLARATPTEFSRW